MRLPRHVVTFGLGMLAGSALLAGAFALPAVTSQGINYRVQGIRVPLAVKWLELLDRDYWFARLAHEVTAGRPSAEAKALALFEWTTTHIRTDRPADWPIVDDHIWHTVIRGYGTYDQCADVLATLCSYAGLPAAAVRVTAPSKPEVWLTLVMVSWDAAWHPFDPYHRVVVWNGAHHVASLDDIARSPGLLDAASRVPPFHGVAYRDLLGQAREPAPEERRRPYQQHPWRRAHYEVMRWLMGIS